MNEIKSSNQLSWILVLLLSSPVIVQFIKITKESIFGAKPDYERTTAMLETALAELITQRRQQESVFAYPGLPARQAMTDRLMSQQKVVYVPVVPKGSTLNSPVLGQLEHQFSPHQRLAMAQRQQEVRQQMERLAMMRQELAQQRSYDVAQIKPQQLQAQHKKLPDERPLHDAFNH